MSLLERLQEEKSLKVSGGIYHRLQIDFAYNSNRIEGSRLSEEQTRYIYETHSVGLDGEEFIQLDDILETLNHFEAFDQMLDSVEAPLTEDWFKTYHAILKRGTSQSKLDHYRVGDYKLIPNVIGFRETSVPEDVADHMQQLLTTYHQIANPDFEAVLNFHVNFERIHPFSDGNGRVGRLAMFKEMLRLDLVPFIITDQVKPYYYRGLSEWGENNGFLMDTCLSCQDQMKAYLDYFRIDYKD
ncbi:Fic family protein [Streptococcus caballi]|uniref:Fic family protein n=1 Tax=Streptococcus caballi TaxID=439220 RepID=UPI000369FF47|nr:Fic family protein [Streptococcus caballi]